MSWKSWINTFHIDNIPSSPQPYAKLNFVHFIIFYSIIIFFVQFFSGREGGRLAYQTYCNHWLQFLNTSFEVSLRIALYFEVMWVSYAETERLILWKEWSVIISILRIKKPFKEFLAPSNRLWIWYITCIRLAE